jgi:Zn-dependent protease with chaperone function
MSKTFQIGLVLLYINLCSFASLLVLTISGVHITDGMAGLSMLCWMALCYSAAWFRTGICLFLYFHTRRPILEEEERLERSFGEVRDRANCYRPFRLLVEEKMNFSAFAIGHNTLVISRGMLEVATDEELKGVMAHELGHLVSKDGIVGAAFVMAGVLPRIVKQFYRVVLIVLSGGYGLSRLIMRTISSVLGLVVLLIGLFWLLDNERLVFPMLAFVLFVMLFSLLDRLFRFFSLMISRFTEYKQDAYAWQLGYGSGLRKALQRLAASGPQVTNSFFILMNGTHPMIYNRIRRLEKLEGLR